MHAHLPKTIISDKGSAFVSQVIEEVINLLEIYLEHAATKIAQTTGMLEKAHASTEKVLETETGEQRSKWPKYINIAFLNYITTYHTSNGCEHSRVFHGRIPSNVLDLWMGSHPKKPRKPNS